MTEVPIVLSDLKLAASALKDRKSEEVLLRRVYPRIVQVVRMAAGNRSQVDDIAQLAAIQVMKSLRSYRGEGSVEAWAGRIAYRTAMRALKKTNDPLSAAMPVLDVEVPCRETPEKSVSRRQLFEKFLSEMDVIPERRRVPFLLHLALGYSVKEVAELTEASQNTVKDRLKTAFREFQSILDAHPGLAESMLEELR